MQWAAVESTASKIGCTAETPRRWVRQAERDQGLREGPTTAERQRVQALEHEVRKRRNAELVHEIELA
ncbi:hypothetical protein [Tepidimonas sp.]|uniref:hypothetical protein n=1 Tax=Tepidimonas sp. TaxID=2002775 RepID=UPI0039191D19